MQWDKAAPRFRPQKEVLPGPGKQSAVDRQPSARCTLQQQRNYLSLVLVIHRTLGTCFQVNMTLSLLRAGRLTPSQGSWATSGSAHRKSLKVRFCSAPTAQHAPVQTEHMLQQQVAVALYSTRSTKAAIPVLDSHLHGMNCLLSCACSSRFECTVGASACSCYHACAHVLASPCAQVPCFACCR